jgi:hypothetical protein
MAAEGRQYKLPRIAKIGENAARRNGIAGQAALPAGGEASNAVSRAKE